MKESPHWRAAIALFRGPLKPGKCLPLNGYEIQRIEDSPGRFKIVAPREDIVDVFQLGAFVSARHLAEYLQWAIEEDGAPDQTGAAGDRSDSLGFH